MESNFLLSFGNWAWTDLYLCLHHIYSFGINWDWKTWSENGKIIAKINGLKTEAIAIYDCLRLCIRVTD